MNFLIILARLVGMTNDATLSNDCAEEYIAKLDYTRGVMTGVLMMSGSDTPALDAVEMFDKIHDMHIVCDDVLAMLMALGEA